MLRPFEDLETRLGPSRVCLSVEGLSGGGYRLIHDGETLATADSKIGIVNLTLAEVNRAAVGGVDMLATHAGVVGRGSRVIAFPASSGSGKSTLTAACLLAGFDYWSDEALILASDGGAIPYPRPLSLSAASRRMLGLGDGDPPGGLEEVAMTPEELGAAIGRTPGILEHVVILERREGPPKLTPLPSVEIVTALLSHSFNHYRDPQSSYRLACAVAGVARAWHLGVEAPRSAAQLLWERLGDD